MIAAETRSFRDPALDTVALELTRKIVILTAVIDAMIVAANQQHLEIERLELLLDERRKVTA